MPSLLTHPTIKPVYSGIVIQGRKAYIALNSSGRVSVKKVRLSEKRPAYKVISASLSATTRRDRIKIIAAGIIGDNPQHQLVSELWLKQDIVPILMHHRGYKSREEAQVAALEVRKSFDANHLPVVTFDSNREVHVSDLVRLDDYKKVATRDEFKRLEQLSEECKAKKGNLVFINSTPRGGGVAIMRHALIRIYKLLGVDAHWHVMSNSDRDVFEITKKKFHNVLQGVAPGDVEITANDIKVYDTWIKKNAKKLTPVIKKAKVIIIDDPQPSGLITYIKKINPHVKIIYRSHIHLAGQLINQKDSAQFKTWDYIWRNVQHANLFVSHPVKTFIPPTVPKRKIALMPATTDRLDGLNKRLTTGQMNYYFQLFNKVLVENKQTPLDRKRPYIVQIARFDPSKGILDVIEAYRNLRWRLDREKKQKKNIPQLVIVGHGALDDPEGTPILTETMHTLNMYRHREYAPDIKVARIPASDQILNALMSGCRVALQLSYKEGFEVKISEAIAKGKPVIAYKTGGIPLQIEHGKTGYLVDVGDTFKVASYLHQLLTDKKRYQRTSEQCLQRVKADFFTVANATRWLYLATQLMKSKTVSTNGLNVDELIRRS